MNDEYITISQYIESKSALIGKVATYDLLIEKMEATILDSTLSGVYNQMEVDDGQMKVRSNYRNIGDLISALEGLRKIRQDYINRFNGRVTRLVGGRLY